MIPAFFALSLVALSIAIPSAATSIGMLLCWFIISPQFEDRLVKWGVFKVQPSMAFSVLALMAALGFFYLHIGMAVAL